MVQRRKDGPGNLFISVRKPHTPVKPVTIGHWIKNVMTLSGIDTNTFSAHSTRGTATSKVKAVGLPVGEILKTANWSSSSTFCHFYNRPVNSRQLEGQCCRADKQVSFEHYHIVS